MKAIILAAGYGNRMRPLTDHTHKTLLKICDETIMGRILDGLAANGVKDVVVVTGYLADQLQDFLKTNYAHLNFTYVHNPRFRETNNIYSLALAYNSIPLDDDIILIESDLIYEPPVIERVIKSPYPNVALVDKFRSGMDGTVVTVADNIVTNIIPTHLQTASFDFSDKFKTLNIYKFSKDFSRTTFKNLLTWYSKVMDDNCYYELMLGVLIYMGREVIHAEVIDNEAWAEVDDPNDLAVAEFVFDKESRVKHLERTFGGYWNHTGLTDYCFIRNMYFPNNSMLSQLRDNLHHLLHNYGSKQEVLNRKLSYFLWCKEQNVNLLNGASQIYPFLKSWVGNQKVLLPSPTFGEYTRIFESRETYGDRIGIDPAEVAKKAAGCGVVVFVNPNNPTGSTLSTDWIHEFAKANPKKTVIIDESFIEFSGQPSILTHLEKAPVDNVVVVKSLSKNLGVPGVRLGYAYSTSKAFNDALRAWLPVWNANSVAEYFLEIILKHRNSLNRSYQDTVRDREAFAGMLRELPFVAKVHPSGANFLLVDCGKATPKHKKLDSYLLAKHCTYVKDVTGKLDDGRHYIRLAVRLPAENQRLVQHLKEAMERA